MMDYKKKYLKYKKKYLAIKKLNGGMMEEDMKKWSLLPQEGLLYQNNFKNIMSKKKEEEQKNNEKQQAEKDKERRKHRSLMKKNNKIFKLYEVEGPTQFPERIGLCEGPQPGHVFGSAIANAVTVQYYFDRFIVVVNENYDKVEKILKDDDAERLIYPEEAGKTSHKDIYSDHDAISMNINIPSDERNYPIMKLITFNLEGFCWGNEGTPEEEWSEGYNEERLNNVVSLIKPYIQPNKGNIFLFQEVVLKKATTIEEENKKSLTEFKIKLNIGEDSCYTLIHDGLTGAILYDNIIWELDEKIEILRHFVEKNEYINITDNKKSNAYKLRHILQEDGLL